MNTDTLLSIIIPVYNCAPYLRRYLDSVIAAELAQSEIILVDDGSTDNSLSICRQYERDYSFIHCISQNNAGPSAARNRGLRMASGKYIAFHDGDDFLDSRAFQKAVVLAEKCEADIFASDFFRVTPEGAILDKISQIRESTTPILDSSYRRVFASSDECVWNVWRYIFRRDFLEANDLTFTEGCHCGEDMELMIRALVSANQIAFYHLPYYHYCIYYAGNLMCRYTAERTNQLMAAIQRSKEFAESHKSTESDLLLAMLGREYVLNLSLYAEVPSEERAEALTALHGGDDILRYTRGIYRLAAVFVRMFGIKLSAWILARLKWIRRKVRG